MFFLAQDKKIEISNLVFTDNLSMYHNVISFTSPAKLYTIEGKVELDGISQKIDVCITTQQRMDNGLYKVDCVSKPVKTAFNNTTEGYNGYTTINSLFAKLGFSYYSDYKSNNTYFNIPKCRITTLFDIITNFASFANGGGAHFYMKMDGGVYGYDYKLIKEKGKVKKIEGQIISEQPMSLDWNDFTTSEYDLFIYDNKNNFKKETLSLIKGFGKSSVLINDTTGLTKDATKQQLTNKFYNKWYSSCNVTVGTATEIHLGDLVDLNGFGYTYIVRGITMQYNEVTKVPSVSAELISNPIF